MTELHTAYDQPSVRMTSAEGMACPDSQDRQAPSEICFSPGKSSFERRQVALVLLFAVALTSLVSALSIGIAREYLESYPYFFDAVSYSYHNAILHLKYLNAGVPYAVWSELVNNTRYPLRTIPLLLTDPSLLSHQMGHVVTAIPAFLTFVLLLGLTTLRRAQSVPYAIAAMVLFSSLFGIYDPNYGIATYWMDFVSALWAGSAALCLVNSDGTRSWKWMAAFALFVSFATLSRYIACAYVFFSCAPILLGYAIGRLRAGERALKVLAPLLLTGAIIAIVAGWFLVTKFQSNVLFYKTYCYSLGQALVISLREETHATVIFFGLPLLVTMGLISIVYLSIGRFKSSIAEMLSSTWLGASTHVLMVLILKAAGGGPQTYYAVPLLFFALIAPASIAGRRRSRQMLILAIVVGIIGSLNLFHSQRHHHHFAVHPSSRVRDLKALDLTIAEILIEQNRQIVWNAFFDEHAWKPTMEAYYKSGRLNLPAGQEFFTVHESGWRGAYPGFTPGRIAEYVKKRTAESVDLAIAFTDPDQVQKSKLNNDFSRTVAAEMSRELAASPQWTCVRQLDSAIYGKLSVYLNKRANPDAYWNTLNWRPASEPPKTEIKR